MIVVNVDDTVQYSSFTLVKFSTYTIRLSCKFLGDIHASDARTSSRHTPLPDATHAFSLATTLATLLSLSSPVRNDHPS